MILKAHAGKDPAALNAAPPAGSWLKNFRARALTALTLGSLSVGLICAGGWGLFVFCAVVSLMGLLEFYRLVGCNPRRDYVAITILSAGAAWTLAAANMFGEWPLRPSLGLALLVLPIISIIALYHRREQGALQQVAFLMFGLVYVLAPFLIYFVLSFEPPSLTYDYRIPLGVLLLHWLSDTAAYFAGRFLGRRSLFPRISPKKTWEGFLGGVAGNLALGYGFEQWWPTDAFNWIVAGFLIAVVGMYGDLVESMFKRNLAVKDSGSILPGHGGVLDRFDGFLFAVPTIYVYQQFYALF